MIFTFYNSRLKSHVQHTLVFENESLREKARSCIPLTKLKEKSTNIFNSKSNSDKNGQFSIWNVFILLWVDIKIFLNFFNWAKYIEFRISFFTCLYYLKQPENFFFMFENILILISLVFQILLCFIVLLNYKYNFYKDKNIIVYCRCCKI